VEAGYCGYNIVSFEERHIALARSLGYVDLTQVDDAWFAERQLSRAVFVGETAVAVKEKIDQEMACHPSARQVGPPVLVEAGYRGYNIVSFEERHIALAQALGQVDLMQVDDAWLAEKQQSRDAYVGETVAAIKDEIDQEAARHLSARPVETPVLVEAGYRGYNIVRFEEQHFALAQSLGHVDLMQVDAAWLAKRQHSREAFFGQTLVAVKNQIDGNAALPRRPLRAAS
jgi:hypothetical protein